MRTSAEARGGVLPRRPRGRAAFRPGRPLMRWTAIARHSPPKPRGVRNRVVWRGRHQLAREAFGARPTQRVAADPELAGVVGDDHRPGEHPVVSDGAPECPFGGDQHRVRRDLELVDAESRATRPPPCRAGEELGPMRRQHLDHRSSQAALAPPRR